MTDPAPASQAAAPEGWWDQLWSSSFMPHGCCYNWQPGIIWSHVISDAIIFLAYYSIPLILFAFVRKRRDIPFNAIFIIFGVFILACGTTHLLDVIDVYVPLYRLAAAVKIVTAIVSIAAVWMLVPVLPQALALPSLKTTNARLESLTGDLRRSNAELEQFAYIASHDLQEPLRMISVHLDLLSRSHGARLDDKGRSHIDVATAGAERMRQLISSLLAFARIDQIPTATEAVDANLAVADALQNLAEQIAQSRAEIACDPLPRVPMERGQLTLIFQNLISNAVKFGRADSGPPQVAVRAAARDGEVVFSVQDNGIGIDPAHFARIFLIFQRIHDRKTFAGSGIGLASVKKVVERHGGRIWVESRPGAGATFHFSIPDHREAAP